MTDILLYAVTVAVWGSSWLAVKYQLGVVAPEASILYRFALAVLMLFAFCILTRRRLRFPLAAHAWMALQGGLLFCVNYILIYLGTQYLTSGLVAVVFSTMVVMNIFLGAALFGQPVRPRVLWGALLGLPGIGLVFWPEIAGFAIGRAGSLGLALTFLGTLSASLGMLTSGLNQRRGLPVIEANAFGMLYGTIFTGLYCVVAGIPLGFDPSPLYWGSLLFLALFATVIGFWSYLTLLGRIGADRAGYASVLFPIVALALSTLFEGFRWTPAAAIGIALVLVGNGLVLSRRSGAAPAPMTAGAALEERV